jgi:DNA-binding response OmpR family regulator
MHTVTLNSSEITDSWADRAGSLSPRERAIFEALLERPGRPMSRRQLRERLYGAKEPEVLGNPIEVHIHNLRVKLGEGVIRTIRGLGYFIVSERP